MLRAWPRQLQESGFSCALRLLQVVQSHLVLRLQFLLVWAILLLLPLLCPACPAVSSVRRILDPAGIVVACPAIGPTGDRRSGYGGGLLPLVLLLAVGRGTIAHLLRKMTEPRLLLPKLDVRLEVLLGIFALLRQVTACLILALRVGLHGRLHELSTIARVLVVDHPSPSGGADDDWSSAFDTVDFDRDDSFWSVLGLIRNLHAMEEPIGTP